MVLTLKLLEQRDGDDEMRLLKIDLGELPGLRIPHPLLLGLKSGICLHKHAATANPTVYESDEHNAAFCQEYAKKKGSMMLLPACGEPQEDIFGEPAFVDRDDGDVISAEGWSAFDSQESSIAKDRSLDSESVCSATPPREITVSRIITPEHS